MTFYGCMQCTEPIQWSEHIGKEPTGQEGGGGFSLYCGATKFKFCNIRYRYGGLKNVLTDGTCNINM
jgi:hypothetical protein